MRAFFVCFFVCFLIKIFRGLGDFQVFIIRLLNLLDFFRSILISCLIFLRIPICCKFFNFLDFYFQCIFFKHYLSFYILFFFAFVIGVCMGLIFLISGNHLDSVSLCLLLFKKILLLIILH